MLTLVSKATITVATSTSTSVTTVGTSTVTCQGIGNQTVTKRIVVDATLFLSLPITLLSLPVGGEILGISFVRVFLSFLSLVVALGVLAVYGVAQRRRRKKTN